jgi:cystathionine beta-lyase/cystathionine gamma-synthase
LTDLAAVARLARAAGALSVCDNTFASPLNRQPLALGIDVVVHSATKYLGGHHDITAGAVIGPRSLIDTLWPTQICLGATLSPMDAWLLLRGLRTLALRVRQHNASALELARWLERQSQVERVFYPGLPSHPQHALAATQMTGFGGVMNIVIRGGYDETSRFVHALKLPRRAVSLGGVEASWYAAAMWRGDERRADARGRHRTQRGAAGGWRRGCRRLASRPRTGSVGQLKQWGRRAGVHRLALKHAVRCATLEMET